MMRRILKKLLGEKRAVTAIEFAFTAPVVLLMIFGTIDISWMMLNSVILENAAREAGRAGITGYVPTGMTRSAFITQKINDNLIVMDPAKVQMTSLVYNAFSDISKPEPYVDANTNGKYDLGESFTDSNGNAIWDADMGVVGLGGSNAIVVYRISYPYQMMTPMISNLFPNNGSLTLKSNIVVRNEPF